MSQFSWLGLSNFFDIRTTFQELRGHDQDGTEECHEPSSCNSGKMFTLELGEIGPFRKKYVGKEQKEEKKGNANKYTAGDSDVPGSQLTGDEGGQAADDQNDMDDHDTADLGPGSIPIRSFP